MVSGFPDWQQRIFSSAENFEQLKISATDSEATTSFAQQVSSMLLFNNGPNDVFINFDTTATTNNFPVISQAWISVDLKITDIHTICKAAETATVFVIGVF